MASIRDPWSVALPLPCHGSCGSCRFPLLARPHPCSSLHLRACLQHSRKPGGRRTCAGRQRSCTCAAAADDGPAAAEAAEPDAAPASAAHLPAAPTAAAHVPAAAHAAAADADDGAGAPRQVCTSSRCGQWQKIRPALTSRVESAPHQHTPIPLPSLTLLSSRTSSASCMLWLTRLDTATPPPVTATTTAPARAVMTAVRCPHNR